MKTKSGEPTITEVANEAGVSIATVSRVLNDKNKVKPATMARVLSAIEVLGYRAEENTPPKRNGLAVTVLPNLDNPFYSKIIRGIQASAKNHELEVLIYPEGSVDTHSRRILDLIEMTQACGLILLSPVNNLSVLEELNAAVPLVQCAEYNEKSTLPYVSVDDFDAARFAVRTLLLKGRRRIAMINGPDKFKYARQRYLGYEAALREAGMPLDAALCGKVTEMGFDSAMAVARQMLLAAERPDAVLATSDMFAAAVVKVANMEGIKIPSDLSLIGFDNTYIAHLSNPSVTAVNMPQFQLGYMAGEILSDRMLNPLSTEEKHFLLKTELVMRDSV